jgi:hypothetical protein
MICQITPKGVNPWIGSTALWLKTNFTSGVLPREGVVLQRRALGKACDGLLWIGRGWFMAWKQDLAKLKQQLGPEVPLPAPKPTPKPAAKAGGPPALDDEDAVFLSAMGLKPAPRPAKPESNEGPALSPVVSAPPAPESFQEAVKDLKGFKPLAKGLLDRPPAPKPSLPTDIEPVKPALAASPAPVPQPALTEPTLTEPPLTEPTAPEPLPPSPFSMPMRFQLAAGMAIEVDGVLDLRGHSLSDAMERLKDRLGDGLVLGWRSLLLTLGPDPALHEGFLALLASGGAPMVARYAQAPVPMGGTQAWLLYFTSLPVPNA